MASKQVTDRQKGADAVLTIFDAQGGTLADASGRLLGEVQTIQATLNLLQSSLKASRDAMVQADTAHEGELADDTSARDARDEIAAQLNEKVVELRSVLTGMYSAATARAVIVGATPRDPVALDSEPRHRHLARATFRRGWAGCDGGTARLVWCP